MRSIHRLGILVLVASFAAPAAAENGVVRCRLADGSGRRVDGTCVASGAGGDHTCTTAGGTCDIGGLAPGDYRVTARVRSGHPPAARTVRVASGATVTVVLSIDLGTTAPDLNAAGPTLSALQPTSGGDAGTRSDAGTSGDAGTTSTSLPVTASDAGRADADAGTAADAGSSGSGAGTLAVQGRVSDSRGRIVDGTVTATLDGREVGRAATSGGQYRLSGLPNGSLVITFRGSGGATATQTVRYAGSTLTVNLSAAAP